MQIAAQTEALATATLRARSFDDLVGAGEDRLWDRQAERLGGFQIDY